MRKLRLTEFSVHLPFNIGGVKFTVDEKQQIAAWELYVELVTRIASQPMKDDDGLMREAMSSIYNIFDITRTILKKSGPDIANGPESLGAVALAVLNNGLRPFLSYWHPRLLAHEKSCPSGVSAYEWEQQWKHHAECRAKLVELQTNIRQYVDVLGKLAGVLLIEDNEMVK